MKCCGCKEKIAIWMPSVTNPPIMHYLLKSTFAVHQAHIESISGPEGLAELLMAIFNRAGKTGVIPKD